MGTTRPKHKKFRAKIDMVNLMVVVGMIFSVVQYFRKVVKEYEIKNWQNFIFKRNDSDKVKVLGVVPDCLWLVYALKAWSRQHIMQVKRYNVSIDMVEFKKTTT